MRTNITIGAILLVLSLRGYFCAISEKFQEVQNARGKEFTMTVMKEVSGTIEDCALLCMLSKTCLSFFHDKDDDTCRLITGTVLESQMTLAVPSRPQMSYFLGGTVLENQMIPTVPSRPEVSYYTGDSATDNSQSSCPADFDSSSIPGVCFKIIEESRYNDIARTICESYSSGNMVGHLLTVYTEEMFVKLATMMSSGNYNFDGYKQLPDETWVDWKGDELAFVRWDGGEPDNNNHNPDPTMEQCVFMRSDGEAHDIPCSGAHPGKILCQLEYVK